jgi:site-specific recombinase XerD
MESLGMLKTDFRNKGNKRRFIPLTEKTRDFLYEFYHQYNDKLYDLLSDFKHRWKKEPYHLYKSRLEKQT